MFNIQAKHHFSQVYLDRIWTGQNIYRCTLSVGL